MMISTGANMHHGQTKWKLAPDINIKNVKNSLFFHFLGGQKLFPKK